MKLTCVTGLVVLLLVSTSMSAEENKVLFAFAGADAAKEWQNIADHHQSEIARRLGRDRSTIRRDLRRHGQRDGNSASAAPRQARPADASSP